MKVILRADVKGHGKNGQMVEVSDGYARNYLFPRKLAVEASTDNINTMKQQDIARKQQAQREKEKAEATAGLLKEAVIRVPAKAGANGRLFGSVTSKEIAQSLKEQHNIDIDRHKLVLDEPLKQFGKYEIKCRLGHEVTAVLNVEVGDF